ncbi:hypothetical protein QCA50_002981 [Cerrena zonata]|uniref:Phorbol-ester/DAG-type domain-containing protein n=1 Tax=Cerrena zonata TaxID=2478898 RepID=A0AAW0GJ87_9APHY
MVGNPGNLRIETNLQVHPPAGDGDTNVSASLLSPSGRGRSLSFSQNGIPSLRISSEMPRSPVADSLSNMAMSQGIGKARNESRKLLAHILGQLKRRPMPPTLFKSLGNRSLKAEKGLDTVVRTVRVITAMKAKKSKSSNKSAPEPEDSDEDFIDDREFHTDGTFDLLGQARDVLMISAAQRWDIFSESGDFLNAPKSPSRRSSEDRTSFLRRRSVQASRSRSRSTSPSRKQHVRAPELLSECISILSSIISEDCRYQIAAPKPSKPSFSLQILTLDIAQFLLHAHRNNPRTVSQITLAIIPAFHTFPRAMHTRLLAFFEEGVLGEMLDQLGRLQGRRSTASHSPDDMLHPDNQAPMVSIQVDEVQDSRAPSSIQSWRRWTSPDEGIHAGTTPEQEPSIYYLTSVVSPLLAAILENVDLLANKIPTVHRFHHLIDRLIKGKPEVYLDLLSVIAYHTPRVRHRATSLLLSYWPKAVGHIVLTKPFPDVSYAAALARETIRDRRQSSARLPAAAIELSHAHQFVPWHFSSSSLPQIFEGFSQNECRVCSEPMEGFGLSCPFCMCSVHFDCYDYPEGSFFAQYSLDSEPDIQKVAVHRFCHVLPFRRDGSDPYVRHREHFFRLVNIFSLALCFVCQKPLWGCVTQGLKCNSCKHFVHTSCVRDAVPYCREESVTSSHMTVKWSVLRRTFVDHYRDLAFTEAEVSTKSYEEVCVFFAVLWTQLQILDNGIALGSIVIDDDSSGRGGRMQDFELHYLVALYKALLSSGNLPISGTLAEYLTENGLRPQDHVFYFDWNTLAYIISAVKLPHSDPDSNQAPNLLNVGLPSAIDDSDDNTHPFEVVSLAHVRNQLGDILQLTSESAVRHLLSHVQHIGILHRLDQEQDLWNNTPNPEQLQCSFPIPFGFDVSADIETLVAVIEACLSDLDLSVNEAGLLLLIRRFWPNGMLTAYSFQRLSKAILTWIFAEDDNLIIIMREYVARGRNLPGVRSGIEVQTWPSPANTRAAGGSSNSGGDYVASRRALLQRYAAPWMLAFHDRDITAYANTVYELLVEHAEGAYTDDYFLKSLSEQETQKRNAAISDRILRHIIKICQASVVFTVFEDLFHRWLEQAHMLNTLDEPNTSLTRLFNAGSEAVNRFSSAGDQRGTFSDVSSITNTNPLYELLAAAKVDKNGFQHGLHWLCLFVSSTVDVPITAFTQMAQLAERFQADLDDCALLIKAALWSSYQKSLGRQELQGVVAALHVHLTTQILDGLRSRERVSEITTFIRQSLATCLLLYGCDREGMKGGGIILEEEIKVLVSRRKLNSRASMLTDPIIVDPRLMAVLKSYVEMGVDEVSCLAARFLNLLVNESPLLESYEVDNFILRNGPTLCQCMWSFYGIELSDVSVTRAALLLRILVVDTQPFQSLLVQQFEGQDDWQLRMQSLSWLFRMVLDVTSPAFVLDDRQWRPSIIDIFYYFFSALWLDDREEIRLTVETWSQTLLPAHHEAITLCWNEALSKAPIGERSRLIHFLLQLRPHFPLWRVLHWDGIIETLLENDFDQRNGEDDDGAAAAHLSMYGLSSNKGNGSSSSDSELRLLQVSLLSLSLRMIADGITIDIVSLLKIKEHLVRLIGSPEVSLVSSGAGQSFYVSYGDLGSVSQWSFPCLDDLLLVLDAWHPYDLSPSAMGGPYANEDNRAQLLIGSAFADVLLSIFIFAEDIINLPPLTLKNLLKALLACHIQARS